MSRRITAALAGLVVAGCCASAAWGQEPAAAPGQGSGNVTLLLGKKFLDQQDWVGVSSQTEFGLRMDYTPAGWPVGVAFDLLYSSASGSADLQLLGEFVSIRVDVAATTVEADLGLRKYWTPLPDLRLFAGGGGALIWAWWKPQLVGWEIEITDNSVGYWLCGGVVWALAPHVDLGVELRWSSAAVTIGWQEIDAGGVHAGALVGYHW